MNDESSAATLWFPPPVGFTHITVSPTSTLTNCGTNAFCPAGRFTVTVAARASLIQSAEVRKRIATKRRRLDIVFFPLSIRPEEAERTRHEDRHLPAGHCCIRTVVAASS